MTDKGHPAAQKPAKAAASGLARFQRRIDSGRSVRFRFVPVALLAFAAAGLWAQIARPELPGFLIVILVWVASGAVQAFSPLGNLRGGQLDERETALVRSGHAAGHFAALVIAVIGCLALGLASTASLAHLGNFWRPASGPDWFALAFFLLAVANNIGTLAASAKLPRDLDEEEE